MTGEVESAVVAEEQERLVLIEIRDGLYCTQCKSLDQFYEQGRCCNCDQPWETEVLYEKDYPDYWKPVTIMVIERSNK